MGKVVLTYILKAKGAFMKKHSKNKKFRIFVALLLCVMMCISAGLFTACGSCDGSLDDLFADDDTDTTQVPSGDTDSDTTGDQSGESGESSESDESTDESGESGETSEDTEKKISVVRVKREAAAGERLTSSDFELVEVYESAVPNGAITSLDKVVGKYATINIVVGEYMFERMVSDTPPAVEEGYLGYVIVSDEIDISGGKDITTELQTLVDKYPGRTIYFSDGEYNISAPIVINADTDGAVSLRLSNYAVIKALPTWSSEDAMITVGSKTEAAKAGYAEVAVMGGVIDGAGVAKIGVSFENCKNPFVSNVTFKNLKTALWAKASAEAVNFESVTVNGDASVDSIGILVESSGGIVSTSNIANVYIGVKSCGSYNDFRNVLVYAAPTATTKCAFWENGENNVFEMCTSQNFSCGYLIKDSAGSIFEASNSSWESADTTVQTAFEAEGTFNSIISGCTVRFFDGTSDNAYIKFANKGTGVVKVPIFDEDLCDDQSYKSVLSDDVIPIT